MFRQRYVYVVLQHDRPSPTLKMVFLVIKLQAMRHDYEKV
jgi:hypothetical protein